ncbi:hypothetical protein V1264_003697 [Littorina saxatilis]
MERGPAGVVTLRDIRKDERNSILACAGQFRRGTRYYSKPGIARRSLSSNLAVQTSRMAYTTLPTLQSSPVTSISLTDHLPPTIEQNRQSRESSVSSMDKLFASRKGRFDSKRNSTASHWEETTQSPSLMWRRNTMKPVGARGSISGWSTLNKSGYRRQSLKRAAAIIKSNLNVRRVSPSQGKPGPPGTAADTNQPGTAADTNQPTVNVNSQRPRAKSITGLEHSVILESTVSHGHDSILPLPVDDKSKKFSWPTWPVQGAQAVRPTSPTDPPTASSQTGRKLSGEVTSRRPSMNERTSFVALETGHTYDSVPLLTSPGPSSGVTGQGVHASPSFTPQACDEGSSIPEAARAKRRVSMRDPPENTSQSRESDTAKRRLEQDRSHSSTHDTVRLSSSDGQGAERVPSCTNGIQHLMQSPSTSRDRGKWVLDVRPEDAIPLPGENTRRRDAFSTEGSDGRKNQNTNRENAVLDADTQSVPVDARPTSNAYGTDVFKAETKSEPRSTQETGQRSDDKGEETKRGPTAGREDRPGATKRNDRPQVPQERRGKKVQVEDTPSSPSRPRQQGQSRDVDQSTSPGHASDRDSPRAQAGGAYNSTPPQSSPRQTGDREGKDHDSPTQPRAKDSDFHGSQPNEADKIQQQADPLVERGSDFHGSQQNEADKSLQLADQLVERGSDSHGSQPNEAEKSQQQADPLVERGNDSHGSQPTEGDNSQQQQSDPLVERGSDFHGSQPNEADTSPQQQADPMVERGSDSHDSQPNEGDKSQHQQADPLVERGSDSHDSQPNEGDKSQHQQPDPLVERGSDSQGSQPNEADKSQQQQADPLVERGSDSHGSQPNEADTSQQQQADPLVERGSDSHGNQPNESDKSQQQQADPLVESGSDSHGSQPNEADKSQQQQADPLVERGSDSHGSQPNDADKSQQQQADPLVERGSDSHGSQPNEADTSQQQQADPLVERGSDSHGSQPNEADRSQQQQADPLVERGSDSHGSQLNEADKSQQKQADPLVERGSDVGERKGAGGRVVFRTRKSNKPKQEGGTQTPRARHSVSSTSSDLDHT